MVIRERLNEELKKGKNIKEILKNIAEMDVEDFIRNPQNPPKTIFARML